MAAVLAAPGTARGLPQDTQAVGRGRASREGSSFPGIWERTLCRRQHLEMTSQSRRNRDRWSGKEEGICGGAGAPLREHGGRREAPFRALPDFTRFLEYSEQRLPVQATTF